LGRHWGFTKAHNDEGVVRVDSLVEVLEQREAVEVLPFPATN
jgi:hypothetical protein